MIYQEIFDEVVFRAIELGFVDGKHLYTDSTHLKANANRHKYLKKEVEKSTRSYLSELDADITEERKAHGKKELKKKESAPELKEVKVSTSDPDSGYMVRDGNPKGFFYLDHCTVDGRHNIIDGHLCHPGQHA